MRVEDRASGEVDIVDDGDDQYQYRNRGKNIHTCNAAVGADLYLQIGMQVNPGERLQLHAGNRSPA